MFMKESFRTFEATIDDSNAVFINESHILDFKKISKWNFLDHCLVFQIHFHRAITLISYFKIF